MYKVAVLDLNSFGLPKIFRMNLGVFSTEKEVERVFSTVFLSLHSFLGFPSLLVITFFFFLVLLLNEQSFLVLLEKLVALYFSVTSLHFPQMKLAKFSVYVGK